VGSGSNRDVAVKTPSRNNQESPVHLKMRKRRPADGAEGPAVPCRWQGEARDVFLTREPRQRSCAGEEIGGVGRPGVLSAVGAMTQVEAFEVSCYLEPDDCAEASSGMNIQAEPLPVTQRLSSAVDSSLRPGMGSLSMSTLLILAYQVPPAARALQRFVRRHSVSSSMRWPAQPAMTGTHIERTAPRAQALV
jgi:hypothetical protein